MSDIIKLLPDSVANQIAAGEVVQRPASAVKEMLENSIDAEANNVSLIIKEAGKTLIQVIDDGRGMSMTDARMSFERHATSKISKADDLFAIRTMGFRGEALASIASVAHIELKTRRHEDEIGTQILIEGSIIKSQEPIACNAGTSIAVRNLFYNIPARRKFLKSNPTEMRCIIDEFQRIALAYPNVALNLHHDDQEIYRLPKGNLKQRILSLFNSGYNERLVSVKENTPDISIKGFIGKPSFAKRTRGEQFFFVNNRYIKDNSLYHAVMSSYDGLLPQGSFPFYLLHIDIDPKHIDINIHPTKHEIKFDNEKEVYAILRSAVSHAIGRNSISPSIDFDSSSTMQNFIPLTNNITMPEVGFNPVFNPFESNQQEGANIPAFDDSVDNNREDKLTTSGHNYNHNNPRINYNNWEKLYDIAGKDVNEAEELVIQAPTSNNQFIFKPELDENLAFQLHNRFILSPIQSGFILIDQQLAHERILFERYMLQYQNNSSTSQQCMFPKTIDFNPVDFALTVSLLPDLKLLGFDLRIFGTNTLAIDGVPSDLNAGEETNALEEIIEIFKYSSTDIQQDRRHNLAKALAKKAAIKQGIRLDKDTMSLLIDQLFGCQHPKVGISGKDTYITITLEELIKRFN